jgi:hypothetical protein
MYDEFIFVDPVIQDSHNSEPLSLLEIYQKSTMYQLDL